MSWEDLEEVDPVLFKHMSSLLTTDMDVDDPYNEFYFSYMVPSEQLPPGTPAREVLPCFRGPVAVLSYGRRGFVTSPCVAV